MHQCHCSGAQCENVVPCLQVVRTAAPVGLGLQELEEAILLQAEMLEVAAPVEGRAEGSVVEARLDKGQGPVATVVVRTGTLRVGDAIVVGKEHGKVRQLRAPDGRSLEEATPGALGTLWHCAGSMLCVLSLSQGSMCFCPAMPPAL